MAGGAGPLPTGNLLAVSKNLMQRDFVVGFCLVTSLFFAWGFAYGLLDVLNKHFQETLNITKLQSTGLQVAYFGIGYFCFSPVAGEVLRRFGYKKAILMGLTLYSTGAILFWPVAHYSIGSTQYQSIFGGFVACTALTACGLATLEVTANSYVTVMRPPSAAAFRLQLSQSFNGVASFTGPLIASKYFFGDGSSKDLTNVQYVYMAVAGLGLILALLFVFIRLPEVSEAELQADEDAIAEANGGMQDPQLAKGFWKQYRAIFGFGAQFMYVGAQVTIGSFFLNYATENGGFDTSTASQLLSYGLITFTVGRFISTALLAIVSPSLMLGVCALVCCLLTVIIGAISGTGGVIALIVIMFFEACQYPIIFVLSTQRLGRHTRRAAALLVMGVAGGAVFPPIQGAIADAASTKVSYFVALPAFVYIAAFSFYCWFASGRKLTAAGEATFLEERAARLGQVQGTEEIAYASGKNEELRVEEEKF